MLVWSSFSVTIRKGFSRSSLSLPPCKISSCSLPSGLREAEWGWGGWLEGWVGAGAARGHEFCLCGFL